MNVVACYKVVPDAQDIQAAPGAAPDLSRAERVIGEYDLMALEEAAKALEGGQFSGILESEEGFSILRRLASQGEALAGEAFDRLLQETAEGALVQTTADYDRLDAASFDKALTELRETEE